MNAANVLKFQERPYQDDSTASRLLSEVKHPRAWLVLRWGTTLESQVLFFCYFIVFFFIIMKPPTTFEYVITLKFINFLQNECVEGIMVTLSPLRHSVTCCIIGLSQGYFLTR